ncbi:MAG: aminodeoxychorismate synthase component I [Candidatus Omnitrophica bacterium]|nr:aminodeoxychorismate synthase component I [Candidatus Omnitrophota bacterium]
MQVFTNFEGRPLYFEQPEKIICCYKYEQVTSAFNVLEQQLRCNKWIAGFFSYELGYHFEERFNKPKPDFPLLMLGVYNRPAGTWPYFSRNRDCVVRDFYLPISFKKYQKNIHTIRDFIAEGQVYQITYCIKFHFKLQGSSFALFQKLLCLQPVPYSAFVSTGDFDIISLSPERFIKKIGKNVLTEPMKGTWPRGKTPAEDRRQRLLFQNDEKNKAENLMITDLLRNDLGRIGWCVRVPYLFTVTDYTTLFQMTSTVTAKVEKDISIYDLLKALFPSGSVTGAPKIRAMQIIQQIEDEPRRIYTGALGYISPKRNIYFNIPIRTILRKENYAEMGVGGGIVWDSTPKGEWKEGLLKASFLTNFSNRPINILRKEAQIL